MDKIKNLQDLKEQRRKLKERIKQLENDLKKPLTKDLEEDAVEEQHREIVYSLYQVERENLARIDAEIRESI